MKSPKKKTTNTWIQKDLEICRWKSSPGLGQVWKWQSSCCILLKQG